MSAFASRVAAANSLVDQEFGDDFWYQPMQETINAGAEIDSAREAGQVRVVVLQPGAILGAGVSLNAMHTRSAATPTLYFMRRGLLTDVRRFDRFYLRSTPANPETGTKAYEVGDPPIPIGFGRMRSVAVEIFMPPDAVEAVLTIESPATVAILTVEEATF